MSKLLGGSSAGALVGIPGAPALYWAGLLRGSYRF